MQFVLHGIRARAYGALGDKDACDQQIIAQAETAYAGVRADRTPRGGSVALPSQRTG